MVKYAVNTSDDVLILGKGLAFSYYNIEMNAEIYELLQLIY